MSMSIKLVRAHSLKFTPFLNAVLVYFVYVQNPQGELWTTLLKCAPVIFLMMFVVLKGFALSTDYKYSQRIVVALFFSCIGDALLNIDLFPHGMAAFALAQIFYISAFGWSPLKPVCGLILYISGAATIAVIFPKLEDVLIVGLPVYTLLLLTMCWRAMARTLKHTDFFNVICAVGAVLFVISDGIICFDMFYMKVPYDRIFVMVTYYGAQFGIALSTICECKQLRNSIKSKKVRNESREKTPQVKRIKAP